MGSSSSAVGDEQMKKMEELAKTLKEGERILAPTRRPDGTLRKPIRIRAGYVPQEEQPIYQPKGALLKKEMAAQVMPPGYDPDDMNTKPKTKAAKRNERKKEKRQQQAALEKEKLDQTVDMGKEKEQSSVEESGHGVESVKSLTSQMNELAVSANSGSEKPPSNSTDDSGLGGAIPDIDKKIRALKKKIRLAEAQQQKTTEQDMKPEQLEKLKKIESWREELKLLEDKKAESAI